MVAREAQWRDEDELIAGLAEFGLGRNEARLYLAAVGRPPMRAAELAQLADIGRTKAYDALRLLVDKGLFTEQPGRVARFLAADPKSVAQRLRQQTFLERESLLEDTSRLVADLFQRYYATPATEDPFDFVQLLRQGEAAWARQEAMIAGAQREVVRTRRLPPPGSPPPPDPFSPREGVSHRAIYERAVMADRRMCVVDRRSIMLSLNPTGVVTGPGNWLALEHPGVGRLLTEVFEREWSAAVPPSALDRAAQ
jgi:predicted DNA-binding transcriptional regulator